MERYVIMKFLPEKEDNFLEIFMANKERIASFEGCTYLELRRSEKNPSWFMTYSLWDDERYLDMYRNSQLFKIVWSSVKPLFAEEASAVSVWPAKENETEKRETFLALFGDYKKIWNSHPLQ